MDLRFWKRQKKGKNKELNERLQIMQADMENNYKDAAQLDYKKAKAIYEAALASGKMSQSDREYYAERMEQAEKELAHFTHFEGPGTGRYDSGTGAFPLT